MIDQINAKVAKYVARLYDVILCLPTPAPDSDAATRARSHLHTLLTTGSHRHILLLEPDLTPGQVETFCIELLADLACLGMYREGKDAAVPHVSSSNNKFTFRGKLTPAEELAVKQAVLDVYHEDPNEKMEVIEERAAPHVGQSRGIDVGVGRVRRIWRNIVTDIQDSELTDIKKRYKGKIYRFVKAKQCLELFKERDGMRPRGTISG